MKTQDRYTVIIAGVAVGIAVLALVIAKNYVAREREHRAIEATVSAQASRIGDLEGSLTPPPSSPPTKTPRTSPPPSTSSTPPGTTLPPTTIIATPPTLSTPPQPTTPTISIPPTPTPSETGILCDLIRICPRLAPSAQLAGFGAIGLFTAAAVARYRSTRGRENP